MSTRYQSILLFIGFAFALSSCSDKTKLTAEQATKNLIAKEQPSMVMSIAAGDILEKSGMADGSVLPMTVKMLFGEMLSYATESEKTGIDMSSKSYVLIYPGTNGAFSHVAAVYTLKDAEVFAKMIKEDLEVEPSEKGKYKYVISPDNDFSFAWYKHFGMVIMLGDAEERGKTAMEAKIEELMTRSIEEGELPANFTSLFTEQSDFAMYIATDGFVNMASATAEEMEGEASQKEAVNKMKELYKDCYTLYTVSFETDKIAAKIKNYFTDKAKKEIAGMTRKGISADMLNYLTSDQMLGFFTCAVSAESIFDFGKKMGGDEFNSSMDEFNRETGIQLSDIVSSFSGDFTMSFVGMTERTNKYEYTDENGKIQVDEWKSTSPSVNLCFGIKNNLIRTIADTTKDIKKEGNIYAMKDDLYMVITDNKMFLTTSQESANEVAANGSLKPYSANGIEKKATENAAFGYFDFKSLITSLGDSEKELQQFLAKFDNAVAYGDTEEMVFELNFRKTGENGLYIITKSMMDTYFNISF
ncbi:MAG TPA: hypothetical protein DEP18_05995 [Flavobacteriales bacterium]|nr:hypothetical protein [Flavobacteriales bacterium]HRJ39346.1 DUF4836 family protein [Flavobacteriales bacterium]